MGTPEHDVRIWMEVDPRAGAVGQAIVQRAEKAAPISKLAVSEPVGGGAVPVGTGGWVATGSGGCLVGAVNDDVTSETSSSATAW